MVIDKVTVGKRSDQSKSNDFKQPSGLDHEQNSGVSAIPLGLFESI